MKIIICILITTLLNSKLISQNILKEAYFFYMTDGEVNKISQRNDTFFSNKCYYHGECIEKPEQFYKICEILIKDSTVLLKLEELKLNQNLLKPFSDKRFSVLLLKNLDSNKVVFISHIFGFEEKEIREKFIDSFTTASKFGFTYFSNTYSNYLKNLKSVTNICDIEEIEFNLKTEKFIVLRKLYETSKPNDIHGSGLIAELINLCCVDLAFNPISAGRNINRLMRNKNN